VGDSRFWPFIDRPVSIIAMEDVWAAKRKRRDVRDAELKRSLPSGWTKDCDAGEWNLPQAKSYTGAGGGPTHGPTGAARTCCELLSLAQLFILFLPLAFLEIISKETNRFGNEDWVRPAAIPRHGYKEEPPADDNSMELADDDTEIAEVQIPVPDDYYDSENDSDYYTENDSEYDADKAEYGASDSGSEEERDSSDEYDSDESYDDSDSEWSGIAQDTPRAERASARRKNSRNVLVACDKAHPQARHRFKGGTRASRNHWRSVTPGYVLVFLGVLCVLGATKLRVAKDFYSRQPQRASEGLILRTNTSYDLVLFFRNIYF
jgi:hypothetical protein